MFDIGGLMQVKVLQINQGTVRANPDDFKNTQKASQTNAIANTRFLQRGVHVWIMRPCSRLRHTPKGTWTHHRSTMLWQFPK
jgi:hypothetical protein